MADYRGGNRIRYFLKVQGSLVLFAGGARKTGILLYFQGGCTCTAQDAIFFMPLAVDIEQTSQWNGFQNVEKISMQAIDST
jgi:hypothetical protein